MLCLPQAMDIISCFNPGDDGDDDDDDMSEDDNMSDDSLSEDSFHKELAGTDGPITPPQQHRPPSPPPPQQETSPPALASLPRMPLGAVRQYPVSGGNGSGGEGCGEGRTDLTAAMGASRTGLPGEGGIGGTGGERKTKFRHSEGDKTE